MRPWGDGDRQTLHPRLAINLLLTVIPSINLVLSNPWSVGQGRGELAQWKLGSARIANKPPDLIFREKEKKKKENGLGRESKTQESLAPVPGPWLALLLIWSGAKPASQVFCPIRRYGEWYREIPACSYFVFVPIYYVMCLWDTIQQILNKGNHINNSNTDKVIEIRPVKTKRGTG